MNSTGIILTLAYPETIVMVADEWYSPYLKFLGVGKKNYVRAGHAALVLIEKSTGILEYHDFGRYITPIPNGRVRGKDTDHELEIPITADITHDRINNLDVILKFLATHPKLTHGDGKLIASVCHEVDYNRARDHITQMQQKHFIRYAAFIKDACNCARFVTDSLIAAVNNDAIKRKLIKSKRFTPSTVGNVIIADSQNNIFEVSENGAISNYQSSVHKDNRKYFLDRLKTYEPQFIGTTVPKPVKGLDANAQWLNGIAAGAWFELHRTEMAFEFSYRRISPYGNVDVHANYIVDDEAFKYEESFEFVHYSNCAFFHIKQNGKIYKFVKVGT